RGLQVTQNVEDTHVTLTPVNPNGPQESSFMSSFVSSMLNPTCDVGVESIFMTASSPIVSVQAPTPIMTPSTIATITTSSEAPIPPPRIPSIILENLPTFNSTFRFEERLRSLETSFSEYRQTNQFADAVSAIPGIVQQFMTQQMMEAVREAVPIQTDHLQDSLQRENDEFLRKIDENMKKIIKGQVKNQVKEQVSRILPRIEESVNGTLEAEVLSQLSHSSRTSYAIAADLSEMELKKILIGKMEGNKSIQRSDEQRNLTMATTIEQQVALNEARFPSAQRLRIGCSNFRLPSDIQSKESTLQVATSKVHQHSIRFKMDTKKHIIDLESFREMLHISPRVLGQSFTELPFEEEILEFLWFLGHSAQIKTLTDVNVNKLYQPWRSFAAVINKCLTGKSSSIDSLRHQDTQQYGAILPIELTTEDIRNTKAYKEYYACATGEAAPKPKASARRKRGDSASSTTPPTPIATQIPTTTVVAAPRLSAAAKGKQPTRATSPTDLSDVERTEAEQLKIILKRSRQETHICQHGGFSTDEGTVSKLGVLDVPSDDSKEEISWNSSDDEDVDDQPKGSDDKEGEKTDESNDDDDQDEVEKVNDDDDDEEEIFKIDEQEATESGGDDEETESDRESEEEETREKEEESFDLILRTPEDSEDDGNGEDDQGLMISEEERIHEEDEADELYRDVDINQGRGLQVSLDIEDSHVTLTSTHSDGQQESSTTSSFVTSLLNPIIDPGMESIFTTGSSTVTPIPSPKYTMTPTIIMTTTTASQPLIPPTPIPSDIFPTLPTFASVFRFEDRVKSLEVNFSNIPEQVKSQVKAQVTRILPRIEESVNTQLEAEVLTRSSHSSRTSYAMAADLSKMELKKIPIEKMEGNKSIQRSNEQRNLYKALVDAYEADKTILESYGETTILKRRREDDDDDQEEPSARSDRGSKRRREGGEHASASTPSEPATTSAGRSTTGTQSRQMSASESALAEEPVQTTCQMEEPSHPVFEIGAEDQPIIQPSQHPEWFFQPRKPPTPNRDWNKSLPAAQGNTQLWISALAKQTDARSSFNELLDTPIVFSNFIMNWLDVATLTPELLAGPTYELIRGSCNSLTELEYHLEEVYKATTDQLDWVNPEGQQYPHNLLQPLPLIPDNRGRRVIPFKHFINNDLEYLWGGDLSRKYTTSVTKTKAADYGHIKWIEDLVPCTMWIQELINYDKHALWGVSHWGRKRQQFYGFAVNRESILDVYSKRRIISVTDLKIDVYEEYRHSAACGRSSTE
nr:hypothetical protein [Tanacetum cinerariifolium]